MYYVLSVIVPVYNAEKYIKDTLESLCNQTIFKDIEVIIIDDGSTDRSLEICNIYAINFPNIKVYSQANQGVSSARNTGIVNSSGKYITFLDADDYIYSSLYEEEIKLVTSTHADIGIVDFYTKHPDGKKLKYRNEFYKEWEKEDDVIKEFFSGIVGNHVTDKIFASKIAKKIEFPLNFKVGEDMWFVFSALCKSQKVVMDSRIAGYVYVIRELSAMTGEFSEKYFDSVVLSERMCDVVSYDEELFEYAQAHLVHESCKALEYVYRHHAENKCRGQVSRLKNDLKKYSLKSGYKFLVRKQFYGFVLMRMSPYIYLFFHRLMKIG